MRRRWRFFSRFGCALIGVVLWLTWTRRRASGNRGGMLSEMAELFDGGRGARTLIRHLAKTLKGIR